MPQRLWKNVFLALSHWRHSMRQHWAARSSSFCSVWIFHWNRVSVCASMGELFFYPTTPSVLQTPPSVFSLQCIRHVRLSCRSACLAEGTNAKRSVRSLLSSSSQSCSQWYMQGCQLFVWLLLHCCTHSFVFYGVWCVKYIFQASAEMLGFRWVSKIRSSNLILLGDDLC